MKITKKRLQQLIRESIDNEVGDFGFHEITNSPIYVTKERQDYLRKNYIKRQPPQD